jgi:hypothetical protein
VSNNFGTLEWRYIRLCDLDICRWCRMWTTTFETLQRDQENNARLVAGLPCFELNSWLSHRTWHNESVYKDITHKWWGLLTHMEFCNLRVTGFWVLGYPSPPLEWGNMAWSGCTGREGVPLFSDPAIYFSSSKK